jgi:hypothetical protein
MFLVLIAVPFITTVGIPIPISPETRFFNDAVQAIPENGVVLWLTDQTFTLYESELKGGEIALYKELFKLAQTRNVKLVFSTTDPSGQSVQIQESMIETILEPQGYLEGLAYGENYVLLGWLPGVEAAMRGLVEDTHAIAPTDNYGTPIDQIPMMEDIRSGADFSLLGWSGYYIDSYMRQWSDYIEDYDIPAITILSSAALGFAKPWFAQGFVHGYLAGPKQCAEFELVTENPGPAVANMDAQYLATVAAIIALIIPNILYWGRRAGGGE